MMLYPNLYIRLLVLTVNILVVFITSVAEAWRPYGYTGRKGALYHCCMHALDLLRYVTATQATYLMSGPCTHFIPHAVRWIMVHNLRMI